MEKFDDPRVISLDASRFDLHVHRSLLLIEHGIYLAMNGDPELAMLLSWQLDNKGRTSLGIKYKCKGRRMSGDMNTALGNCILMIIMVATFMRGKKYDILDDGDDCLLIVEAGLLGWVLENAHKEFLAYGMEIKIENVATKLEEIEWCQCKPIRVSPDTVKFVRNPHKVLSTALGGTKYFVQEGARRKLVNTIGMAELILNLGVPVLQEYALALMRNASTTKTLKLNELESYFHRLKRELQAMNMRQLARVRPAPIQHEARMSFALAFGIPPSEQIVLEEFFKRWVFIFNTTELLTPEGDVVQWKEMQHYTSELYSVWDD
jgi:hypothetical protein